MVLLYNGDAITSVEGLTKSKQKRLIGSEKNNGRTMRSMAPSLTCRLLYVANRLPRAKHPTVGTSAPRLLHPAAAAFGQESSSSQSAWVAFDLRISTSNTTAKKSLALTWTEPIDA